MYLTGYSSHITSHNSYLESGIIKVRPYNLNRPCRRDIKMEMILIVLVVIAVVGTFKAMNKEERSTIIKSGVNTAKVVGGYSVTVAKDTAKAAYSSGQWVGNEVSLNHQETLTDLHKFNTEMTRKGAVRVGVKAAKSHLDTVGIAELNKAIDDTIAAQLEALNAARTARETPAS